MTDRERLLHFVETWHDAVTDFLDLARGISPDDEAGPTDLPGWSVKDLVAHTAHLESVLAGAAEETLDVPDGQEHVKNLTGLYTEQGVLARRDRTMTALVAEIEGAVERRYASLLAAPPTDGSAAPPRTPGGVAWDTRTLLSNRPLDVWMHEQDIRRAVDRPGGMDSPAAAHTVGVFVQALPMVVGKRVQPPAGTSVLLVLPETGLRLSVAVNADGRAAVTEESDAPDVTLTLTTEDFIVLAGGRRTPEQTRARIDGDTELGAQVLAALAVTP